MSLRVCAKTRLFFTSPRCCCKRRLNTFRRSSLSSRCASATVYSAICLRRSLSFDTLRLPSCNKACFNRQFVTCQTNSFFGGIFAHTADLEDDTPWLDDRYPMVNSSFTTSHAGLGGFGGNRLVREHANPYLAPTFHKAGERDTGGLGLTRLHPARLKRLQPILAKGERVATMGLSLHTTAMLSAVLCT